MFNNKKRKARRTSQKVDLSYDELNNVLGGLEAVKFSDELFAKDISNEDLKDGKEDVDVGV